MRLRRARRVRTMGICTATIPRIEIKDVPNDRGARHFRGVRHDLPRRDEHRPRRGQRIQERRDKERVGVSGRVCIRREDVLPELSHALYVRGDVAAFFGELRRCESAHGERFLELRFGSEVRLERGPDLLRRRGLLEYPNPSVPDVDQELQPRAGIPHLPAFQRFGLFRRRCRFGAVD